MKVADWLHTQARERGTAPAMLTAAREVVSFGELDARVAGLRQSLREAGLRPGDRVLALLPAGTALVELLHATVRCGAVFAPLDPRATLEEALWAARLVRPRIVVGATAARAAATVVAESRSATLWVGEPDDAPLGRVASAAPTGEAPSLDLDAPHTVVFTSGTTGRSRGVVLSAANHLASARASARRLGVHPDDRWLACLPLHHVGGLAVLLRAAIHGTTVALMRGFDPAAVARALREDAITQLSLVPTALRRLLAIPDASPGALRFVLLGGARADRDLVQDARARGWPVAPTYGLTETCSQVATARADEPLPHAGFVGSPLAGVSVRILAEDGRPAAPGEAGEIEVTGPTVAIGCLDDRGALAPLGPEGRLRTADLGWLDAAGALTVVGRGDDVIVSGGENVAPEEVEAVLLALPAVADAGVAAVPDAEWGQAVCAWVVARPGRTLTLEEVREACATHLARHKLPRRLVLVDELPRTTSGKLRRRALAAARDPAA